MVDQYERQMHNVMTMNHVGMIRNFVIIAHIDHGKSTLADRFLEYTNSVEARHMKPQLLDQMDLERERGITIKMQPVRMVWNPTSKEVAAKGLHSGGYVFNLIDTPGHIDFSYEVSRALAAVEGTLLLVDATQGVQAQTLTNLHIARQEQLAVIPVVNKIDAPGARIEDTRAELAELADCAPERIVCVSAKTGEGLPALLQRIVADIPPPHSAAQNTERLRALIFDSKFESHRGVVAFVRIMEGMVAVGTRARLCAAEEAFDVKEVGVFSPRLLPAETLTAGDIGYIVTGVKEPALVGIGDTIVFGGPQAFAESLPGYRRPKPVLWASFYPEDEREYESLRDALARLQLNDASFTFEPESSAMLGRSFKCGFLGMLHLEIITERLKREFSLSVVTASPSLAYEVTKKNGDVEIISSAAKFPAPETVLRVREPWMSAEIIVPDYYLGGVLSLIDEHEGAVLVSEPFAGASDRENIRMKLSAELPLREIVSDFFDKLNSVSSGYASLAYEPIGMRDASVERIEIRVADDPVPPLARIVSKKKAHTIARAMVTALKDVLPRQLFLVKIQAVIGGRIIASESLSALKKDVTGHLYGGDRSRKMKLWKKQKQGKKKLIAAGKVRIPPEAYLKMLKR